METVDAIELTEVNFQGSLVQEFLFFPDRVFLCFLSLYLEGFKSDVIPGRGIKDKGLKKEEKRFSKMCLMAVNYKQGWYETMKPNYLEFDEGIVEFWKMKYEDRWAIISDLQGKNFFDKRRVLDLGCGMGRALSWFKSWGNDCVGVEPSIYAAKIAGNRGITVINDYFENVELDGLFDVIHIEQMLSHAPEYKEILRKACNLLAKNGILVVEEPNDNNPLQKGLEAEHGQYWITPDHCNYFNYVLLSAELEQSGFEVVKKSCTYPMELFEYQGDKYLGNEEQGKTVHKKRFELEHNMTFTMRQEMHGVFANLGWGRDCVVFCKKRGS